MKRVSQTSAKVATQDLYGVLPVYHIFGNIMGSVYWKPIWNVLEGELELLLCNAQHIKAVPGRKTDVKDAEWIADLLHHGLLRPSFVPPLPKPKLRNLPPHLTILTPTHSRLLKRIQQTLP